MAIVNRAGGEISFKIVYYGPGLCGKTTNIEQIHARIPPEARGKMFSVATEQDRTLFFDLMRLSVGEIKGYKVNYQLLTVPGQYHYNESRRRVLTNADGVVFVADSQPAARDANEEAMANLYSNLASLGKAPLSIPIVLQYNKRDLPGAMDVADMAARLNPEGWPAFLAVATEGKGVFETLHEIMRRVEETF